jgi:hypothetical protein
VQVTVSDELSLQEIVHASNKIKSFSFDPAGNQVHGIDIFTNAT